MKKLIYILTIIVFCSCLVTNKYKAYNFSNGGTIYDNYQDHHWAGEYKGKKYKVIVENVNEHQKSFNGRLIINKDTGKFGVGKVHLYFPNRDNKDTLLRNKLRKYNNLTSYNCDTIFLFYRYKESANQVNSHVRIPLLKKENKYFQPFQQKDFISKNELQNYYIIENNGLEGYPIDIGYGNRYILKNKSKIFSISDGEVWSIQSKKNNINGNCVLIKHNDSVSVNYINLDKIKVKEGGKVNKGDIIGTYSDKNDNRRKGFGFIIYLNDTSTDPSIIYKLSTVV